MKLVDGGLRGGVMPSARWIGRDDGAMVLRRQSSWQEVAGDLHQD